MNLRSLVFVAGVTSLFAAGCGEVAQTGQPADAGVDPIADASHVEDGAPLDAPPQYDAPPPPPFDASAPPPPPAHAAVLFGGDGPQFFGDTWEWDGTAWTERVFDTAPSPRSDMAMASLGNKVVLFGGAVGKSLGDTWEYDGAWTEKKIPGPPARQRFAMATLGARVVLFGGLGDTSDLDDTWEYDGTAWTQKTVTGPSARTGHAMTTLGDKVVLFGGIGGGNLDDTWIYDGASWTSLAIPGPGGPHGINFAPAMAAIGGKVVLFSGELDANTIPADTWEFDGAAWTKRDVTGPKGRWHSGMTTFDGSIVLFGGDPGSPGGGGFLGDTWTYDGATWTPHSGAGPSGRYVYAFAAR